MTDESDLEERLRAVLGRAGRRLDATPPPWTTVESRSGTGARQLPRHRLRVPAGSLAAIVAAAVSVAIVIVALTSLHAGRGAAGPAGRPPVVTPPASPLAGLSQRQQDAIRNDLMTAQQKTLRADHACRVSRPSLPTFVKPATGSPPPAALATFSVLRRPATEVDRSGSKLATTQLGRVFRLYINDVRFLETRGGLRYYIVPVQQIESRALPARCVREELTVLAHELSHASASRRSALVHIAQHFLAYQQRRATAALAAVCVTGSGQCIALSRLAVTGAAVSTSGTGGSKTTLLTAIVPDGPSRITLDIAGGNRTPHGQTPPPLRVTIPVTHNLAITMLPASYTELAISPTKVTWRNATGRALKIFEANPANG